MQAATYKATNQIVATQPLPERRGRQEAAGKKETIEEEEETWRRSESVRVCVCVRRESQSGSVQNECKL